MGTVTSVQENAARAAQEESAAIEDCAEKAVSEE